MVYDANDEKLAALRGGFHLYLNGQEITEVCIRFDPDAGWADLFVCDQDNNPIMSADRKKFISAKIFGNVTITGTSQDSIYQYARYNE